MALIASVSSNNMSGRNIEIIVRVVRIGCYLWAYFHR